VDPFTVTVTLIDDATKENHIPLLVPVVKHDGGVSVPVIPALVYAPAAEQPLDETNIASVQSSPGVAATIQWVTKINKTVIILFINYWL
jgi:hypothetical protein